MLFTILYYIFFASAVALYGVGFNSATILCDSFHKIHTLLIKTLVTILSTTCISWLIMKFFLVPLKLEELYPLFCLIVFIILSIFIEALMRIVAKKVTSDFSLSYMIIILAINESLNILDVILITVCSYISFIILIPILYSLKKRIEIVGDLNVHGNKKSLILVSIAIIIATIAVGNVTWLNGRILP